MTVPITEMTISTKHVHIAAKAAGVLFVPPLVSVLTAMHAMMKAARTNTKDMSHAMVMTFFAFFTWEHTLFLKQSVKFGRVGRETIVSFLDV
eukprot:CAMPEP_0119042354 /NCGR_PEP_ID=MMETSP1177-20130426/14752_1 /TAXON_ID=2985 /ORGANISM="Ochromonas sp, Strain CCMP1899" /LENGTH=91 /DNA_ID=CAMNT_0007009091 /DNA_START=486 /DNA_END=761 /DNA_ORIENTATION=-